MMVRIVFLLVLICYSGSGKTAEFQCYECNASTDEDCKSSDEKFAKVCPDGGVSTGNRRACSVITAGDNVVKGCTFLTEAENLKSGCKDIDGGKTCKCDTSLCNKEMEFKSGDGGNKNNDSAPGSPGGPAGDSGARYMNYSGGLMGAAILFFFYLSI